MLGKADRILAKRTLTTLDEMPACLSVTITVRPRSAPKYPWGSGALPIPSHIGSLYSP
jgi:hypothetical protein